MTDLGGCRTSLLGVTYTCFFAIPRGYRGNLWPHYLLCGTVRAVLGLFLIKDFLKFVHLCIASLHIFFMCQCEQLHMDEKPLVPVGQTL